MSDEARARFEAWLVECNNADREVTRRNRKEEYMYTGVTPMWDAWQACTAAQSAEIAALIHDNARFIAANTELVNEIAALTEALRAVESSEFSGISCNDVNGKNWFDLRRELLAQHANGKEKSDGR